MKYMFAFEENKDGYKKIILPQEIKLIEYIFEDMESFKEPIFKKLIEKVVNENSNYEEISGNICNLEIKRDFTIVSVEFLADETINECRIETDELLSLILEWINVNKLYLC
ncbi:MULTISPECIES: hypothetical protein [Clostridium]|uniref:hypothetical protein n=1 Tax=Clostridium TaxID=1485 RepID=UPI000E08584C|nr:hypothetical protein [Clostridium sporogenes]EJO5347963.1 hypothetical protein [Clostridium botulinum]MCW6087703.1 hypothetical protein [Clostridium sporogenes]STC72733.1 Uncharacterised protein [Clostridium botulinum]